MSSPATPLKEIYPGLYLIAGSGSHDTNISPLWVYFLIGNISKPLRKNKKSQLQDSTEITLETSWNNLPGWYFFIGEEINAEQAAQFVNNARQKFPPLSESTPVAHIILWLPDQQISSDITNISTQKVGHFTTINNSLEITWSGLCLALTSGIRADLVQIEGYPALQFTTKISDLALINLKYYQVQQTLGYRNDGWMINLYLDGPGAGSLNFGVGLNVKQLTDNFGCNFSYAIGQSGGQRLQYPLYDLTPFQSDSYCAFDIWLNPLLPLQAGSSRFQLDTTGRIGKINWKNQAASLKSYYFFTNNGVTLQLTPLDPWAEGTPAPDAVGAGFAFSWRPTASSPFSRELYLTPIGEYQIETANPSDNIAPLQVMPGLFTREYFRVNSGDNLRLINNQPAYAEAFTLVSSPSKSAPDTLETFAGTYTTSWAQWQNLSASGQYFGQPSASPFFGEIDNVAFPLAIDVLLETFTTSAIFPWVPYGGLYPSTVLNPVAQATDFTRFEATIIGAVRHMALTEDSDGPIFLPQNATTPDPALRSATNPQGVLIDINSNGSWNSLTLAMEEAHVNASPPEPQSFLQFLSTGSPPCFPKDLALVLTQNQLFYVVTVPSSDWEFLSTTYLGGFKFNMELNAQGTGTPAEQTIMVFKFNTTTTLNDLSKQPGLWTGAASYNNDPAAVSLKLQNYIDFAQMEAGAPDNPFENFNRIVNDKEWTGVLFFNAEINGNGMPADLQMLLGGINGGLRAHHIGIQSNLFEHRASPLQLAVKKSSLFGVIFYDAATSPASLVRPDQQVDYEVEKLIVLFSNSAITQFNTTVGLTLNQLFGRTVTKRNGSPQSPDIPPNTLSIKGKYQANSDGIGRVTFMSDDGFIYDLKPASDYATQVVDYIKFDKASLVPVSSTRSADSPDESTNVKAQFVLSGQLWFNHDPFPFSGGLDLFSYGQDDAGLAVSGLTINIGFTLGPNGNCVPGTKTVALDISTLSAQPKNDAIRPDSLLYSIPLKFSRFLSANDGTPLNASTLGATNVNIIQLAGHAQTTNASPSVTDALPVSYATSSARYGLEYDMQLGSLGALGASARLNAKVILAWGPSSTVPDNDAAALFVQLPQLSAGAGGFELEGILKTTFGDANLLKVDLDDGQQTVYAFLFNNIQLSVFGYRFPPGVLVDFMVFAGAATPGKKAATNANNLAWFLSAQPQKAGS